MRACGGNEIETKALSENYQKGIFMAHIESRIVRTQEYYVAVECGSIWAENGRGSSNTRPKIVSTSIGFLVTKRFGAKK